MRIWQYWSRRRKILLAGALPVLVIVALLVGIAPWGGTLTITSSCNLSIETSIALAANLPPSMGQPEILGSPGPGVEFVGSVTTNVSSTNRQQVSFSHTTPDGTDILVVIVMCRGDQSVSSATYGGQSLTLGVKTTSTSSNDQSVEVWYLVSPPTGSNTVVVNYALSDFPDAIAVLCYTGVDTADPIGATAHDFDPDDNLTPTVDITTIVADSLIVGGLCHRGQDTAPHTPSGPNAGAIVERYDTTTGTSDQSDDGLAGGELPSPTTGSYTFQWDGSASDEWAIACVEVKPAAACAENISNTPASHNFGTVAESGTYTTGLTNFTVTNNSGGAVNISIQGTDMTGGVTWTLSDTATPGADTYGLMAGLEGEDYTIVVKKNSPFNDLVTGLADSATQSWGLKLYVPTSFSDEVVKSGTVTLTATCQ